MKTDKKTIGKRIQKIRLTLGKNTREFGELFEPSASDSIVSRWETGKSMPNPARLNKISQMGRIDLEDLLAPSAAFLIKEYIEELYASPEKIAVSSKELTDYLLSQDYSELANTYAIQGKIKHLTMTYLKAAHEFTDYLPYSNEKAIAYAQKQLRQAEKNIEHYFLRHDTTEQNDASGMVFEKQTPDLQQMILTSIENCIKKIGL